MYAPPAVAGNLLFIGSCNGMFYSLDKTTGKVRWSYDTRKEGDQSQFHGAPLIAGGLIIVGTDGRDIGGVYAFDMTTGNLRWKYLIRGGFSDSRGIQTDILRLASSAYAVALGDELICLDLKSGRANWTYQSGLRKERSTWSQSPAVGAGRVFFGGLDGTVYALDARSGQVTWKRYLGAPVSTALTVWGDLYLGTANSHIYRLNTETGQILADFKTEMTPIDTPAVAGDSILFFLNRGGGVGAGSVLICLDRCLKLRWSQRASTWSISRVYLWHGMVLVGNEDGSLVGYKLSDGSQQWSQKFKGMIRSIGQADDLVYVGTLDGTVYAYRPQPRKE